MSREQPRGSTAGATILSHMLQDGIDLQRPVNASHRMIEGSDTSLLHLGGCGSLIANDQVLVVHGASGEI